MNPILKAAAIGVGAVGAAVGAKEVVSRLTYDEIQSQQTEALQTYRQAEMLGMTEDDLARLAVPLPENMDKEAFQLGFIAPLKAAMNGGSCDARTSAYTRLAAATRQMELLGLADKDYYGAEDDEFIKQYERAMQDQCTKEAYAECVEKHDFSRLLLLGANRERQNAILGRSETDEYYEELLDKCLSFELEYEDLIEIPDVGTDVRAKSLVQLTRDRTTEVSSLILSGEAPVEPRVRSRLPITRSGCSQTIEGPTPKEPVRVHRLELWPDTSGRGALREEAERIRNQRQALRVEEKDGKATSPADSARRARLRETLDRDQAALDALEGKRAGKDLNRPKRIELSFVPGHIAARLILHCPPVPPVLGNDIGLLYGTGWPSMFREHFKEDVPQFVFEAHEIRGGELFARKTVRGEVLQLATGSMTFTLWHRPPAAGIASKD